MQRGKTIIIVHDYNVESDIVIHNRKSLVSNTGISDNWLEGFPTGTRGIQTTM